MMCRGGGLQDLVSPPRLQTLRHRDRNSCASGRHVYRLDVLKSTNVNEIKSFCTFGLWWALRVLGLDMLPGGRPVALALLKLLRDSSHTAENKIANKKLNF